MTDTTCLDCTEAIAEGQETVPIMKIDADGKPEQTLVHKECMFRVVVGGIGHHENHQYWCVEMGDPDGGRTYRQSAIEVWQLREVIMAEIHANIEAHDSASHS